MTLLRARRYGRRLRRENRALRALVPLERPGSTELHYVFDPQLVALRQAERYRAVMDPTTVLRETGLIDSNLVLVRDPYHCAFHAGLSPEIRDLPALVSVLRACAEKLPNLRRRCTLGTSAGGYGALLLGHHLAVDDVFVFAPQTLLDLPILRALSCRRDLDFIPAEHRDLALLLERHNGRTRYHVYYCAENAWDKRQAENIARCPGVVLHPQPGDSHLVYQALHDAGRLRTILAADSQ